MSGILAQIITTVRSDVEDNGWVNILVLVVLAVFYVVGGILKARANKLEDKEQKQPPGSGGKPGIKPPERTQRAVKTSPRITYPQQVQRPARRLAPRIPAVPATKLKPERQIEPAKPLVASKLPSLARPGEFKESTRQPEIAEPNAFIESLLVYGGGDELKKAILHYEILGKPLSLRDSSGHIIGL